MEVRIGGKTLLVVIAVIIIGMFAWSVSGYFVEDGSNLTNLDKFSECLSEKGATLYVSTYCGHCQNQKEMFGDSLKHLDLVECTKNQQLCQDVGIKGVPSWIINGVLYTGVQPLEKLAELTNCSLS